VTSDEKLADFARRSLVTGHLSLVTSLISGYELCKIDDQEEARVTRNEKSMETCVTASAVNRFKPRLYRL